MQEFDIDATFLVHKKTRARYLHMACKDDNIDLCYVKELPGNPLQDAAHVFPMMWRFFPTLDPQVRRELWNWVIGRVTNRL